MKPRILFVCLGNICRSPMAESILRHRAEGRLHVDSAGTGDWHVGHEPDPRTRRVLEQNGIRHWSRARQVHPSDFVHYDHIIAMDAQNVRTLTDWSGTDPGKISLALDWTEGPRGREVPDPYYGGPRDFEEVYSLLSEVADAILARLARQSDA